jgi:hypothetical protein
VARNRREVDLAVREREGGRNSGIGCNVADVGEAFGAQQVFRDILRRDADAINFPQADGRSFRRCLLGV